MGARKSIGLVALLASLLIACADHTAIEAVVVSDELEAPGDVDELRFDIAGVGTAGDPSMIEDLRFPVSSDFPHSLSIRPGDDDGETISIVVTGFRDGAEVVRSASVRATFVPGQVVTATIRLGEAMPPVDAGMDAAIDGGVDGAVDAGDGGPVDAGCTSAAACDDDVECTVDTCDDGACVHTPDDSICADGTTCDPVEGCPPRSCEADDDCLDTRVCNGEEACSAEGMCVVGTPVDCNDGDVCTEDRCSESARGCVHETKDADGDGFGDDSCPELGGVPATDCNDDSPDIFPEAAELCNGADDDCNGVCDDPFTCCRGELGSCTTSCGTEGTRVCTNACSWDICSPPAEICNGIDDDCNGAIDDVFACEMGATRSCTTSCGSAGTQTCDGTCSWSACEAPTEICNGADDDCDGTTDETFDCAAGSTVSCATSCGSTGTQTCDFTSCTLGACVPPAEGCTGVDDDCDGLIDETVECTAGTTESCTTSCGSTGTRTCGDSCTFGSCEPPTETCNGVDDDCDGLIDEIFTCVPGATGSCTTSCATTGSRTCTSSCDWGACEPPAESCNGADDDCDGAVDETFSCAAGSSGSCTTSCGTTGNRTCSSSCAWSACSPPAEECNGIDDDCNGACDDGTGMACCAGTTGSCTTSCGSIGSRECSASCGWGTCSPPAETCSGEDDDCDGLIDEGFDCVAGDSRSCTTSCGSTGVQTCSTSSCTWESCAPPSETCNGVDDDCDGEVDEGCGACGACTGSTTVSSPGGRYTSSLSDHTFTGSCGGAGSEAYFTFTLAETSDVFLTTHDTGGIDTVLYVRECECAEGAEVACNDDADGLTTSTLRLTNLAAGTYNVIVDSKAAMSADVTVDIYISAPGAESDRCGNPSFIPAGTSNIAGNTCDFTHDYDITTDDVDCQISNAGDTQEVVYYFYLPDSRSVHFDGCLPGFTVDSVFYVREVCSTSGTSNQVACNDDGCGGSPGCATKYRSDLYATLGPGLYYFFMDGWDGTCACGDWQAGLSGI